MQLVLLGDLFAFLQTRLARLNCLLSFHSSHIHLIWKEKEKRFDARQRSAVTFALWSALTCTRWTSNSDWVSFWSASRIRSVSLWMMTSNGPCSSRGWLRSSWRQRGRQRLNGGWTSSAERSGFHVMLTAAYCTLIPWRLLRCKWGWYFYGDIHCSSCTAYAAVPALMPVINKAIYISFTIFRGSSIQILSCAWIITVQMALDSRKRDKEGCKTERHTGSIRQCWAAQENGSHARLETQYTGMKAILHLDSPEPAVVKFSHSLTQRY